MQFIDINCMIGDWGYKNLHFKTAKELSGEMERLGITQSMVFDSRSWLYDLKTGNDLVIEQTKAYNNMIPVIGLSPLVEQEFGGKDALCSYMKNNHVGAVRLFPFDQNFTLNVWNLEKLFSILDEVKMPVFIECQGILGSIDPYYTQILELSRTFKNVPIVLLTTGYRRLRVIYELFDKCPNLYVDSSTYIGFRGIEDTIRYYGSKRIIFGTRMPFMDAGVALGRLIYSDISQEDKENIAFRNILEIMANNKLYDSNVKGGM